MATRATTAGSHRPRSRPRRTCTSTPGASASAGGASEDGSGARNGAKSASGATKYPGATRVPDDESAVVASPASAAKTAREAMAPSGSGPRTRTVAVSWTARDASADPSMQPPRVGTRAAGGGGRDPAREWMGRGRDGTFSRNAASRPRAGANRRFVAS